jgi:F420-dependent oxidoreductase-like protein
MVARRPLRHGVFPGATGMSWPDLLAFWRRADELGYATCWIPDHFYAGVGDVERGCWESWTVLSAMAMATERIRLGTMVLGNTFRHPAVVANMAATLDHVSGGRLELGIGAGWMQVEHDGYGIPLPPPRERLDRLDEALQVLKLLFTQKRSTFHGRYYRLEDCPSLPKPLQTPHPPLIMGGAAGSRSAALAARFADEYNTFAPSFEEVTERRRRVVEACERTQRDPATMRFSVMTTCCVGEDRAAVLERARLILRRLGDGDEDPAELLRAREDRWVAGTPDEAIARLRELAGLGVDRVFLQHLAHEDVGMVELLGTEIAPAVA